jgi:hypothetical protein
MSRRQRSAGRGDGSSAKGRQEAMKRGLGITILLTGFWLMAARAMFF